MKSCCGAYTGFSVSSLHKPIEAHSKTVS